MMTYTYAGLFGNFGKRKGAFASIFELQWEQKDNTRCYYTANEDRGNWLEIPGI
jgi:hypothetical protein